MNYVCKYDSPIGPLYLGEEDGHLTHLVFSEADPRLTGYVFGETSLLKQTKQELDEYFAGTRQSFSIPLRAQGTMFQEQVWGKLLEIPYGESRSYKDLAQSMQSPGASRAIGITNSRNPISILIPCHRVIGQSGNLTGYAGGLAAKQFLLELEQKHV